MEHLYLFSGKTSEFYYCQEAPDKYSSKKTQIKIQQKQQQNQSSLIKVEQQLEQKIEKQGSHQMVKIEQEIIYKTVQVQQDIQPKVESSRKKKKKNQYDKNLIEYIANIIIKEVFNLRYKNFLRKLCQNYGIQLENFYYYIKENVSKRRLGSREMYNLFRGGMDNKNHRILGLFMIFYLNHDYLIYILVRGKMRDRNKYLSYASKIMYIPRLSQSQYEVLNRLRP